MNDSIITEFLTAMRDITRLQTRQYRSIGNDYGITAVDVSILLFLHNNPTKDSASDIVELRRIPKGNVSMSIDNLSSKGFIEVYPDTSDKRRKHIRLTEESSPVIERTLQMYRSFSDIFQFEDDAFMETMRKIINAGAKAAEILGDNR